MNSKNSTKETAELVIKMLDYAHEYNLNITNKEDVKKILKAFDSSDVSKWNNEELMNLLQDADTLIEIKHREKDKKDIGLPN